MRDTGRPARRVAWLLGLAALAILSIDLARPPSRQWAASAAVQAIGVYQDTLSLGVAGLGVRCRFVPSCSRYAQASIRQEGFVGGTRRALGRLLRCGPWTPLGTPDPPPRPLDPRP